MESPGQPEMMSPGITRSSSPGVAPRWRLHFCRRGTGGRTGWAVSGPAGERVAAYKVYREPANRTATVNLGGAGRTRGSLRVSWGSGCAIPAEALGQFEDLRFPRTGGNRWPATLGRWRPSRGCRARPGATPDTWPGSEQEGDGIAPAPGPASVVDRRRYGSPAGLRRGQRVEGLNLSALVIGLSPAVRRSNPSAANAGSIARACLVTVFVELGLRVHGRVKLLSNGDGKRRRTCVK